MSLHYTVMGEGEPIVLLHGLFGSNENLGVVARQLREQYQVVSIDLPDHGKSKRSDSFSYENYADSVLETLHLIGMTEAAILGHSMGGKVAMQIALTEPNQVSKLIVADIAPVHYEPRHDNVFRALRAVVLEELGSRTEADKIMSEYVKEPGVRQFLLKSLDKQDSGFKWRFNLDLIIDDYHEISKGIASDNAYHGETLFIKGANSDYINQAHQAHILNLFPKAKAKVVSGTGHWLHAEKPFVFTGIVERFLEDKD